MLSNGSRYFGYTSYVPTIPKNVLFYNCEGVKTCFSKLAFLLPSKKLKVPYLTREHIIKYVQSVSVTNHGDVGYKEMCPIYSGQWLSLLIARASNL